MTRPSTSFCRRYKKDVDARDKPGHDEQGGFSVPKPTLQPADFKAIPFFSAPFV
jgi:hypothetical protein